MSALQPSSASALDMPGLAVEPTPLIDPFSGLFATGLPTVRPHSLIDQPAARHLFETIVWGLSEDLYTYQQPLPAASGPRVERQGRSWLMLSSYDYLGLIGHPLLNAAGISAIRQYGTATGGVRLLTGTAEIHRNLEAALAAFLGAEAAITFTSGYMANVGAIAAVLRAGDVALVDAYAHRSILEGCCLAGATVRRFAHNDVAALEQLLKDTGCAKRRLVAVDGVYSMEGDLCPLPEVVSIVRKHAASLLVDEAHSLGTTGPEGRGAIAQYRIDPAEIDLITGSLSKAIPAGGGFVAGGRAMIAYLQHSMGPFCFSAALPPASGAVAMAALGVLRSEPGRLTCLNRNALQLREGLKTLGFNIGVSTTPIIPVITGRDESAYRLARRLLDLGLIAIPVVAPAVPRDAARLRLCASAAHSEADIDEALAAFKTIGAQGAWREGLAPRNPATTTTETLVFNSIAEVDPALWDSLLRPGDLLATHRFVQVCEAAGIEGAQLRYVLVMERGRLVGAANLGRLEIPIDLLATGWTRRAVSLLRHAFPGLLRLPIVMCGLPVSFGGSCLRLAPHAGANTVVARILNALEAFAADTGTGLLCIKELTVGEQQLLGPPLVARGFLPAPSLPGCRLELPWRDALAYRTAMRAGYRRQLEADRRAAADAGVTVRVVDGLHPNAGSAHRLYMEVIERARFKMEVLPRAFFEQLASGCQGELRSVLVEREGDIIAYGLLLGGAPICYFLLAGINYACLAHGHIYQNLVSGVVEAAISGGARAVELGQTSYALKTRLGGVPTARYLWVRHRGALQHRALSLALPHLLAATAVPQRRVFRTPNPTTGNETRAPGPTLRQAELRPVAETAAADAQPRNRRSKQS